MSTIWAVCSGSGGVGKSLLSVCFAVGAANAGYQTILLDASGTARSCDLLTGIESAVTLDMVDVVRNQASIESALYRIPPYEHLRFACASLYDDVPTAELSSVLLVLHSLCDILVIDLPTGEIDLSAGLLRKGDVRIMVTRPDDTSMRSLERIMMRAQGDEASMFLAINRMSTRSVRRGLQYDAKTVEATLDCPSIAAIPEDERIADAFQKKRLTLDSINPARLALADAIKALLNQIS